MEIERRFLITSIPEDLQPVMNKTMRQYYVITESGDYRLREEINLLGDKCVEYWKTVKRGHGLVREEKNFRLSAAEFKDLTSGLNGNWLTKTRTVFEYQGFHLEVDTFLDFPVKVVEVEFKSVESAKSFTPPDWFGEEITEQPEYNNYSLWCKLNKMVTKQERRS